MKAAVSIPDPVFEAADKLARLFETYRPDVVVTYNEDGAYNHPDHIQASRVTMAAVERTGIPKKVYLSAMRAANREGESYGLGRHQNEVHMVGHEAIRPHCNGVSAGI